MMRRKLVGTMPPSTRVLPLMVGILMFSGCFETPHIDAERLTCRTNDNCPVGWNCELKKCHAAGQATPGADASDSQRLDVWGSASDATEAGSDERTERSDSGVREDGGADALFAGDTTGTGGMVGTGGSGGATATTGTGGMVGTGGSGGATATTGTGGTVGPGGSGGATATIGTGGAGGNDGTGGTGAGGTTLTGTGGAPGAVSLTLSGTSLPLGSVAIGKTTSVGEFTVTNTGQQTSAALTVASSSGAFVVQSGTSGDCVSGVTTLAPQDSCSVRVVFQPSVTGDVSAEITVAETGGKDAKVSVSGTGVTPASLSASTLSSPFELVTVGRSSYTYRYFTLTNTGQEKSGPISVSSDSGNFVVSSGMAGDCESQALAQGDTCRIRVVFKPSTLGFLSGTISYSASPGGIGDLSVSGQGCGPDGGPSDATVDTPTSSTRPEVAD
jgi:hypothetical protein